MRLFVKLGGALLEDPAERTRLARAIQAARQDDPGLELAIVHGGGKQIAALAERLQLAETRIDGLRVTCAETAQVVRWVLAGEVNKSLVASLCLAGLRAVGLCGADLGLFVATRKSHPSGDLGFVGTLHREDVHTETLTMLLAQGLVPVIATIGPDKAHVPPAGPAIDEGKPFLNINADEAAGPLAAAAQADELLMLSDVPGVLDANGELYSELTPDAVEARIQDGTIHGGMIPKVRAALLALATGVKSVRILSGRLEDPIREARRGSGTRFHT